MSLSQLTLTKSYLRSAMGESRLSAMAILSIECEFIEKLDFGNTISNFASSKTWRV